ncbi:hypothetical protein AAFF_G00201040 [Aldrovandia affinis]|uniref:Zona pellucida sperm-binding protein 3 n=1 Tax=Aldrovandia affinis TaxID=143900 RepID=A0AAD7RHY3_9TELE|nr:hypothetical protein AAFF_G00201040 [Aldrovandia affinis]
MALKAFCGEGSVIVEAQMDLLGIGQLIQPSEITLGGCWPTGQDDSAQVLVFETELQGCGSALTMTEDSLTYAFSLIYEPKAIGASPIIRTNGAAVHIKCHYVRLHNVSSDALKPTWIPYSSTMSSEELLAFSLRLMTSNWQVERSSNIFQLGDLMNIEASVVQANHVPLRVFVDGCIATMEPNMHAVPSYTFIENHGCLTDAKLTGSHSTFLPRVQDDKLYFQLDAFRFFQETRSSIYIFCHLKVAAASALTDAQYKACSFSAKASRWVAAGGNDQVCGCCDAGCSLRKGRSLEHEAADQWDGDAMLGPIYVQKTAGNGMVPESQISLVKAEDHRAAGFSPMAVILAGVVFAVGLICATLLGTVLLQRLQTNVV